MSRRQSSGFTGANAIPLGTRNKAIRPSEILILSPREDEPKKAMGSVAASNNATIALKAAQAAAANLAKLAQRNNAVAGGQTAGGGNNWSQPQAQPKPQESQQDRGRPKKKRSRWSSAAVKTEIPGMPASVSSNLTPHQQRAYIVQLQIEDVSRKLKCGDLGIPANPEDRSPSPEPIYNGEGKRMNTREYRTRKRLEEERHRLIIKMQDINPEYKPPMDYKPPQQRISERVMIPQDLNPNINFVGLLIGPRGNTLKKIEKDSNCKIMIRGKGSVKEGKIGRKDGQPLPGEDEPLHALVSANTIECVKKAVSEINKIIKQGIEQPEEDNDLRKLQLMELAKLNGTLREDLMPKERQWLKPENQNITNTMICTKCGGRGHLVQDCRSEHSSNQLQQVDGSGNVDRAKMDSEYQSLMAELGEGPPSSGGNNSSGGSQMSGSSRGGFNNFQGGQSRFQSQRPPWMGPRGPPHFGGPGGGPRQRFSNSSRGGFGSNRPMMNQGAPPPPWMQSGPYGGQGGPNQWGPQSGMSQSYSGGFSSGMGDMPPWSQPDGSGSMMGGAPMGYSGDGSGSGGNYFTQPPPPPPSNAPQPPPPPSSGAGGSAPPWQQWGGEQVDQSKNQKGGSTQGSNPVSSAAGNIPMSMGMAGMDGSNMMAMGGYNMGMWGMAGGMGSNGAPPPMPTGPGPVPPPPPGGQSAGQDAGMGGMDYSMGMNMGMMNYGMPAPPPPPPQ
ncbi:zinc finger protein ZF(CCHC)-13 isoform X2 [Ciona intestinalis]